MTGHTTHDLESGSDDVHLYNDRIASISWESINVRLYDKSQKADKHLLQNISGDAQAGQYSEMLLGIGYSNPHWHQ